MQQTPQKGSGGMGGFFQAWKSMLWNSAQQTPFCYLYDSGLAAKWQV